MVQTLITLIEDVQLANEISYIEAVNLVIDSGLLSGHEYNVIEIAAILKIPKSHVSKIEIAAIKKLTHPSIGIELRRYLNLPNAEDIKYTGHE